jgi:oligopeptide transport system ATP-binding protein
VTTTGEPLLVVRDLVKHFPVRGPLLRKVGDVHAVCGVSFSVGRGETLGIVGESGCGKSTTGRLALGLMPPTAGSVHFDGHDVLAMKGKDLRVLRRRMQMVFQDPFAPSTRASRSGRASPSRCGSTGPTAGAGEGHGSAS